MVIETVYDDAIGAGVEITAQVEVGRVVYAEGGIIVTLVRFPDLLIDVVLYIEIDGFPVLCDIEDSLDDGIAVRITEEREALVHYGKYGEALPACGHIVSLGDPIRAVVEAALGIGLILCGIEDVGAHPIGHLARAVDVGIDGAVGDAEILFPVLDAELSEALVGALHIAAQPILRLLIAAGYDIGEGCPRVGRGAADGSEFAAILQRAVLIIAEGHSALCAVKDEIGAIVVEEPPGARGGFHPVGVFGDGAVTSERRITAREYNRRYDQDKQEMDEFDFHIIASYAFLFYYSTDFSVLQYFCWRRRGKSATPPTKRELLSTQSSLFVYPSRRLGISSPREAWRISSSAAHRPCISSRASVHFPAA